MKSNLVVLSAVLCLFTFNLKAQDSNPSKPLLTEKMIFDEVNNVIPVEAEFFYKQDKAEIRYWVRQNAQEISKVAPDPDVAHISGTSLNSYIEVLPDTRVIEKDKLIAGTNFSNQPGLMAIVQYKINVKTPGRYYVWVRAFSAGSDDNGIHVGLDGTWPEHGQRMQWCAGKNMWTWASKQRTDSAHCGVAKEIYLDIDKAGIHDIQFSMREDGFEFDKFILTRDIDFVPVGEGEPSKLMQGKLPKAFTKVDSLEVAVNFEKSVNYMDELTKVISGSKCIKAIDFPVENTNYYINKNWLAIDPEKYLEATASTKFPFSEGMYDVIFVGVGESDGQSTYQMLLNQKDLFSYSAPLSKNRFEEGNQYNFLLENVSLKKGDVITVIANPGSANGKEYSRGRWAGILFSPMTFGKEVMEQAKSFSISYDGALKPEVKGQVNISKFVTEQQPMLKSKHGNGEVVISGELKQWHKVSLTMNGPFATEKDVRPNPYTDYRMTVKFTHESGSPVYNVPAYFATDDNAAESGAVEGNKWRAHLSPDKAGTWNYEISFFEGSFVATADMPWMKMMSPYHGLKGSFVVGPTDKTGRDFRAKGRLEYVGKHHLQFKGSGEYFFKCGSDAPETLLAFEDFDSTYTMKDAAPVKKYTPHVKDYNVGDPVWKNGKGKGLIGAINYLSGKGVNSISFLTYNAGGDGDNVWPFISRNEKFHYDCSKLDQWQIVFDHAQSKGMHLHFKTQETENDDNAKGKNQGFEIIPEALDGGDLGPERIVYYRELIARFGYLLALNWNLGEENTQSTENRRAMADYFRKTDPYRHNIVLHTYPHEQDEVYSQLLGKLSELTGVSLQNNWDVVFERTLHWVNASDSVGKPWVVANDEQGSAGKGVPPDPGYKGFDDSKVGYSIHDIRKQTLWGNLMAGGAGVEYYFGYGLPENDMLMEDFRSRDKSWDFDKIAIDFLAEKKIPFQDMKNCDKLIGNTNMNKEKHCLAKEGDIYLVYLAYVTTSTLDLTGVTGEFIVKWFNPITGGELQNGSVKKIKAGQIVDLGNAPSNNNQDWVVIVRKN